MYGIDEKNITLNDSRFSFIYFLQTMRKTILSIFTLVIAAACSDDDKKSFDITLLTGPTEKAWYVYAETPEDEDEDCRPNSAYSLDNSWIFAKDGSFEYDHGELTEDPECEDGCCSDLINIVGSWETFNNGKGIRIIADHETGNPDNSLEQTLFEGTIDLLTEDQFKFSQKFEGEKHTLEFRKRLD